MLSKEDYKNYLEQILTLEKKALAIYSESADILNDKFVKDTCLNIKDEEISHIETVNDMIKLIISQ